MHVPMKQTTIRKEMFKLARPFADAHMPFCKSGKDYIDSTAILIRNVNDTDKTSD